MKTKSILFVAIAMIASSVAFADEPSAPKLVVLSQKESGLFKVIYENAKSNKVKMTILDANGQAIYSESLKVTDGFILPVNFKGMATGEYTIEVADEKGKQIQRVVYGAAKGVQRIHVAKLNPNDSKYLLSVEKEGDINVRIFDGANNVVHDQNVNVKGSLGLVYNLTAVSGAPTFEVTDNTGAVKTIKY